jgi:hypothetical protein
VESSREHPGNEPREALSWLDFARLVIGLAIVLGFVLTIFAVTVLQFRGESLPAGISIADISTVYSGLTGAVIGYFFGRGRT